jgi:hypothetical protein
MDDRRKNKVFSQKRSPEPNPDNHYLIRLIAAFALLMFSCSDLFSQSWDFVKEKDGIKIFTRKEANGSLKSFRGQVDMRTSMDKVYAIVGDIKSTDNWDENIREMKILSYQKDVGFTYYLIYKLSWPLHDRDLSVEAKISKDPATGIITVYTESRPKLVPEDPELVRIRNYWQRWTVQPLNKGHVRLVLEGYADPAGNIPGWLYNMVITDTPYKMLRDIRKRVE